MPLCKQTIGKNDRNGKNCRRFKCSSCGKTFKRSEHCARHELMHTQERPYACRYCHKSYGRKDLLRRHERTIHADQYTDDYGRTLAAEHSPSSNPSIASEVNVDDVGGHPQNSAPATSSLEMQQDQHWLTTGSLPLPVSAQELSGAQPAHLQSSLPLDLHPSQPPDLDHINAQDAGPSSFFSLDPANDPAGSGAFLSRLLVGATPEFLADGYTAESNMFGIPDDRQDISGDGQNNITDSSRGRVHHARGSGNNSGPQEIPPEIPTWNPATGASLEGFDFESLDLQMEPSGSPVDAWSKDPSSLGSDLPIILQERHSASLGKAIDETCFQHVHGDISMRLRRSDSDPVLFTYIELKQFIKAYVDSFHQHLPIIHLPSFVPSSAPSPLVLTMASIGALYRLRRRRAHEFFVLADKLISSGNDQIPDASRGLPLWLLQTKILLSLFGVLSNDQKVASETFSKMGFMMLEYQRRRTELQHCATDRCQMTWEEWIRLEETKRALCAMFIYSDLLLVTFNITPGFVTERDLLIEVPDPEALWAAQTAEDWEELRQPYINSPRYTIQGILKRMIQIPTDNRTVTERCHMSGFTALVIMHAVNIHLWHLNQLSQSVRPFSFGIWPHESLQTALLHAATSTLERCQAALLSESPKDSKFAWDDPGNVMLFNCNAVLRSAYSRLLPPSRNFNRLSLLTDDRDIIMGEVEKYVDKRLERTTFVTKAAQKAYEGFLIPVTIGNLLVSKTAALHWSVDQAVAGWDSALLLTKWIHSLEMGGADRPPDGLEFQIIDELRRLLAEMEIDHGNSGQQSLAATLSRAWATFLDDVWVWGITPRMGAMLKLLATQYQKRFDSARAANGNIL